MMIIFIKSPRTITMLELLGFLCPLKNQSLANLVMEQLRFLSSNISIDIQPVFRSKPTQQILRPNGKKPDLVI